MKKINLEKEWNFILKEVHKEKPTKRNRLKREMLLLLQVLLLGINKFSIKVYQKLKEQYLNFGRSEI